MNNNINVFGIHTQAMALRARRAEVLATNLANADTPGYQARDLDFAAVLAGEGAEGAMLTTDARHLGGVDPDFSYALRYRDPLQASLDQNTVDVQAERAAFTDNAMRYQASLTFLNGRIRGLLSALRGE
ncbi:MAG: flagellar basal body rod protein FlgB [Gammaproteobacteria bacterium]|nr:flagellar basal body rod protein FlgB [Gammaproteobacteria bacterium]